MQLDLITCLINIMKEMTKKYIFSIRKILTIVSVSLCILSFCWAVLSIGWYQKQMASIISDSHATIYSEDGSMIQEGDNIKEHYSSSSNISSTSPIEKLVYQGNRDVYDMVRYAFQQQHREVETFAMSLVMANQYDYDEACWNIYKDLRDLYGANTLDSLDEKTCAMAIHYLEKAEKLGSVKAKNECKKQKR